MSYRIRRVSEIIQRELGTLIAREISFPVPLVTVSAVDLTTDLKNAHVFISAIGTSQQQTAVIRLLKENRVRLQAALSKRVIIKNTPHLHFKIDHSFERAARVLSLLDELGLNSPPTP